MTKILDAALSNARRGWAVLPVHTPTKDGGCSCGKATCDKSRGKHPRINEWQKQATTDETTIRKWWKQWPDANIGINPRSSNLIVIDIDPRNSGDETWHKLKQQHGLNDNTVTSLTGGGGTHLLYSANGIDPAKLKVSLGSGVDVQRGDKFIIAPPSLHKSKHHYEWEVSGHPDDIEPLRLHPSLLNLLLKPKRQKQTARPVGEKIPEGERDNRLASMAGSMRRCGMTESELLAALLKVNERCDPPLPESDVKRIAHSIARYDPAEESDNICPPLPESAHLSPDLSQEACHWLDSYTTFSKRWSPRAYEGFHKVVGLWILSTVAARRVMLHLGNPRFPSLYLALTARTSLYAKSTTAEIGIDTLRSAGLDWLLAADDATPQKFIKDLTAYIPNDFDSLLPEQQTRLRLRLALTAQRGWFYEEFGQKLNAMMREGGFMADFRGILRRFDDCKKRYEYGTISRGDDIVEQPYLALLCNLTPADLRQCAKRGNAMWRDGFLARFAFICPPKDTRERKRFPTGERIIPRRLIDPLRQWHERLGMPDITITDEFDNEGERTGKKLVEVENREPETCTLGSGVYDAFYNYGDALLDLVEIGENPDFDGNLARFAEKALRIAMLMASLENGGKIEMRHWARGQEITEEWRSNLYVLYEQLNEIDPSEEAQIEEKLLKFVKKLGNPTAADVARYMRGLSGAEVKDFLDRMTNANTLSSSKTSRTTRYRIIG